MESSQARIERLTAEIEQVRDEFHALLDSLRGFDMQQRSEVRQWRIGGVVDHMIARLMALPKTIDLTKAGRGFNPPMWLANFLNMTSFSRVWIPQPFDTLAERYDDAHMKVMAKLFEQSDEDWAKGARNFREYRTVEQQFHVPREHFDEHAPQILRVLKR